MLQPSLIPLPLDPECNDPLTCFHQRMELCARKDKHNNRLLADHDKHNNNLVLTQDKFGISSAHKTTVVEINEELELDTINLSV